MKLCRICLPNLVTPNKSSAKKSSDLSKWYFIMRCYGGEVTLILYRCFYRSIHKTVNINTEMD